MIHQPIKVGTASANAAHAADLGKLIVSDGKMYLVVKAAATIAEAASRGVAIGKTLGVPNWTVNFPADATGRDIGLVPAGQVGSTGTTSLVSGDYFLLQISGPGTALSNSTLIASATRNGLTVNSKGLWTPIASTSEAASVLTFAANECRFTNTAAVAVSAEVTVQLAGLI
jgi:hypothetical protein